MNKINFVNKNQPALNATNLNALQDNIEEEIDAINEKLYPIGSIYTSNLSTFNPNTTFGGTWVLEKSYQGGELIAYGTAFNTRGQSEAISKDSVLFFSTELIPNKQYRITNYVDGILISESGTLKVFSKGVAGLVDVQVTFCGLGNCTGLWFQKNYNDLPTGVDFLTTPSLLSCCNNTYGGTSWSMKFQFTDEATSDTNFFINPYATPYNGYFSPTNGGTHCTLEVKVFAKNKPCYIWKRTA